MSCKIRLNSGSTLVEVLVAIFIVGLVVTGAMLSIAYSVKNSAEARYREAATQLAQDGMEVVKLRREIEQWDTFDNRNGTYCLSNLSSGAIGGGIVDGSNCAVATEQPNDKKSYVRYVIISSTTTPPTVTATVVVEWTTDGNIEQDVEITQVFQERVL